MGKEVQKYKTKNKGECLPLEKDDLTAILTLAIDTSIKNMGRPHHYPPNKAGLEDFIQTTIDYFEYVNVLNSNDSLERKLIPDIENWCVYLGITRKTLYNYEQRGSEWGDCIQYYKNVIGSVKKQLALNYKIPPMIYVFDATNNHGYVNSNEFKLTATVDTEITKEKELQSAIDSLGLVWDDETKEYKPVWDDETDEYKPL